MCCCFGFCFLRILSVSSLLYICYCACVVLSGLLLYGLIVLNRFSVGRHRLHIHINKSANTPVTTACKHTVFFIVFLVIYLSRIIMIGHDHLLMRFIRNSLFGFRISALQHQQQQISFTNVQIFVCCDTNAPIIYHNLIFKRKRSFENCSTLEEKKTHKTKAIA